MNIRKFALFSLIIAFAITMCCGRSKEAELKEKIVPVELAQVKTEAVAIPVYGSGLLFSKEQIRLSFKTGGIIDRISAKEGQNVSRGQILAELNLDEINAQVQQAKSGYEKAQRDFDRVTKLYADSVVTLEQKQNVETQLRVAEAALRIAEFNLKHSTITAPSDGIILKRFVEPNELVAPGTPVFYFGSGRAEWLVRLGVADRDIIRLQIGDPAVVTFDAYPGVEFPASLTEIAQAADPQNGTFEVEINLDSQGRRLAAGFVAQVTMMPKTRQMYKLVPIAALVEAQGNRAAVFTVKNSRAQKDFITIGPIVGENVTILAGLDSIDKVVTTGAPYLKAGDVVEVK